MFNLSQLKTQSVGAATPFVGSPSAGGYTMPWEAVPLMLNYVLTGGTRDENANFPQTIRATEKVLRTAFYVTSTAVISYLLALGHMFKYEINFGKDWFALIVLLVWYLAMLLLLFSQFNGRLRALPAAITQAEVMERPEFHLPALFFNYQAFGFERTEGYVAAFIVLFVLLGTSVTTGMLIYDAAARLLAYDPYKTGFAMMLAFLLLQQLLTAAALSVSYGDMRAATSKPGVPLTPLETVRVGLVNAYVYIVYVLLLPLGVTFLVYALS